MKTYKTPIMKPIELKTACIMAGSLKGDSNQPLQNMNDRSGFIGSDKTDNADLFDE